MTLFNKNFDSIKNYNLYISSSYSTPPCILSFQIVFVKLDEYGIEKQKKMERERKEKGHEWDKEKKKV